MYRILRQVFLSSGLPFWLLLTCLGMCSAYGQLPGRKQQVMFGLGVFGQTFIGDLSSPAERFTRWYPGLNFSLQFDARRLLSPQLNLAFSDYVAQDRELPVQDGITPSRYARVTYFSADFRLRLRLLRARRLRPHLGFGLGFMTFAIQDERGQSLVNNLNTRAENERYGTTTGILPLTLGFTWRISRVVSTGVDATYTQAFSDYLDNVSRLGRQPGPDGFFSLQFNVYATIPGAERRTRLN